MVAIRPGTRAEFKRQRPVAAVTIAVERGAGLRGLVDRRYKPLDGPEVPGRIFSGWSDKTHLFVLLRPGMLWRQAVGFKLFVPDMHNLAAVLALVCGVRDTID